MTNTITSQADEVSQSVVGEVVTFDSQETVITSTIETPADSNAISSEAETESVSITTTETVSIATEEESVVHSFESTPPKGEKGDRGDPGEVGGLIIYYPVAYAMSGHRMVVINENLEASYANVATPLHANKVLGMTTGAASSGEIGIQTGGVLTEPSWNWILDTPIWLAENGLLTQVVPTSGFSLIIGFPISTTSMFIDIREPIFLI